MRHPRFRRAEATAPAIAIIGAACRLPGAADLDAYWSLLAAGRDAVTTVPADRFTQAAHRHPRPGEPGRAQHFAAGTIGDVSGFDAAAFGISPREAAEMDPQQRLLLEVAAECFEDAGLPAARLAGSQTGVFIGASATDYGDLRQADAAAGDRYFIPERAQTVMVAGEVQAPRAVVWQAGMRMEDYIRAAGGYTPRGRSSAMMIRRPSGELVLEPTQPPRPGDELIALPYLDPKTLQIASDFFSLIYQVALASYHFIR